MKDKFAIFIIGLLLGAVISTGAFYVYTTTSNNCTNSSQGSGMNGGQPPEMPSGQSGNKPPEMPNNNQSTETNATTE